jgi:hypothetical protein
MLGGEIAFAAPGEGPDVIRLARNDGRPQPSSEVQMAERLRRALGRRGTLRPRDFPSVLLPWLALKRRGVRVRYVHPARHLPEPEELVAALTPFS